MKRDWDIIRDILLKTEELAHNQSLKLKDVPRDKKAEYSYHVQLMEEAQILNANISKTIGPEVRSFVVYGMTWAGHELIDAIRDNTVWAKTKKAFKEKGLSMTFDTVTNVAVKFIQSMVGG